MFEQSLLQSSSTESARRSWSTAASVSLQAGALALAVLLPLLGKQLLPSVAIAPGTPVFFEGEVPPTPTTEPAGGGSPSAQPVDVIAHYSSFHPFSTMGAKHDVEDVGPPPPGLGCCGTGGSAGPQIPIHVADAAAPSGNLVVLSRLDPGMLVTRVEPIYPAAALANRIEGEVTLEALISRTGSIEKLHAIAGNPYLVQAALQAVGQWRYRPYVLNGQAVEVQTHVTVIFHLN